MLPAPCPRLQGKIYKLKLTNPSTTTHYFTALEFASKASALDCTRRRVYAAECGAEDVAGYCVGVAGAWCLLALWAKPDARSAFSRVTEGSVGSRRASARTH